jgi:hypothetical protein
MEAVVRVEFLTGFCNSEQWDLQQMDCWDRMHQKRYQTVEITGRYRWAEGNILNKG